MHMAQYQNLDQTLSGLWKILYCLNKNEFRIFELSLLLFSLTLCTILIKVIFSINDYSK